MINNEQIQSKASYWISLEREGQNIYDDKNFMFWLGQREEHKIAFEEEKKFFSEINSLPKEYLEELKNEVKEKRESTKARKRFIRNFMPLTAAACILSILYMIISAQDVTFEKEYMVSNKIRNNILLPDKSIISLDVNTEMNVKYYKNKRLIHLSRGRAVFDVFPDKSRPFLIKTKNVNIQVLGTKFEVVNKNNGFELNVYEGRVKVSNAKDNLLALVTKGKSLSLDKYLKIKSIKEIDVSKIARWKQGKFSFHQVSLENVIHEFSKYIDTKVKIQNPELSKLLISGNFDAYHFKDFLAVLPLIHPVKIENDKDEIIIKEKM